jgi:hypothetical protein
MAGWRRPIEFVVNDVEVAALEEHSLRITKLTHPETRRKVG